jgi:hypothetical protein
MDGTLIIKESLPITHQGVSRRFTIISDPRIEHVSTSIEGGNVVYTYDDPRIPRKSNYCRIGTIINTKI